ERAARDLETRYDQLVAHLLGLEPLPLGAAPRSRGQLVDAVPYRGGHHRGPSGEDLAAAAVVAEARADEGDAAARRNRDLEAERNPSRPVHRSQVECAPALLCGERRLEVAGHQELALGEVDPRQHGDPATSTEWAPDATSWAGPTQTLLQPMS